MRLNMQRGRTINGLVGAGVSAFLGAPAIAQGSAVAQDSKQAQTVPASPFRFEGSIGAEYNSNVNVADLDTSTGQDDWAATVNLLAEGAFHPVEAMTLRAGYDFSQSLHQDFDEFDLAIHRGYAEGAYDFSFITFGVLGNLALAKLDGDDYLTYSQVSPYVSKQFGDKLFLRGSYAFTDKEFEGRPTRDATSDTLAVDGYVFLDGVKRYVVLGAKRAEEDAVSAELDYAATSGKVRFQQRFDALNREMIFRAGVEYEDRGYDNVTLAIGAPRSDKRTTLDLSLEAPIGESFFSEISYRHGGYESNLASANYDEDVGEFRFGVRY